MSNNIIDGLILDLKNYENLPSSALRNTLRDIRKNVVVNEYLSTLMIEPPMMIILKRLAMSDDKYMTLSCLCIITNLAFEKKCHVFAIIKMGWITFTVQLIHELSQGEYSEINVEIKKQALWLLANIAAEEDHFICTKFEHANIISCIERLFAFYNNPKQSELCLLGYGIPLTLMVDISTLLMNLCELNGGTVFHHSVLPMIYDLLKSTHEQIVLKCLHTIENILKYDDNAVIHMVTIGIAFEVVSNIENPNKKIVKLAIRILGDMLNCNDVLTDYFLHLDVVAKLKPFLSVNCCYQEDACFAISQICNGTPEQLDTLFHENIVFILLQLCEQGPTNIIPHALFSLLSLVDSGSMGQKRQLLSHEKMISTLHQSICDRKLPNSLLASAVNALYYLFMVDDHIIQTVEPRNVSRDVNFMLPTKLTRRTFEFFRMGGFNKLAALQHHNSEEVTRQINLFLIEYAPHLINDMFVIPASYRQTPKLFSFSDINFKFESRPQRFRKRCK